MSSTGQGYGDVSPLDVARKEMRPHEHLVWADRPVVSARARPGLGRVLFGLLFAGFAAFWMTMAWLMTRGSSDPVGTFFPFFGIPFFLVGVGVVVAGVRNWAAGGSTVYALSDQRVLVIRGGENAPCARSTLPRSGAWSGRKARAAAARSPS